ncbi:MAG: S8 family serine peptidase [Desulfovibrionaceae bacterium]|nr:S8 family serine peptidase [Desulfovibrionaceae bacterium]
MARWGLFLFMTLCLIPVSGANAREPDGILAGLGRSAKLLSPEAALAPFASGRETARFIVMLSEPDRAGQEASLAAESAKAALRAEVAAALDAFFSRKKAADAGQVTRRFSYIPAFAATLTAAQLQALLADDAVAFVREDRKNTLRLRQGVPLMNASATRSKYAGTGVAVAISDSGVDYMNAYLGKAAIGTNTKVIGGYDFVDEDDDPMDANGHGTACAGIVAGTIGNTGDYIGGVVPQTKIYALKTANDQGSADDSAIIASWEWSITHQNDDTANPILIISTSLGGGHYTTACDADLPDYVSVVNKVRAAGITIFVSSGNEGYCNAMGSPACLSGVISVGAVYDANVGTQTVCVEPESCLPKTYDPEDPNCPYSLEETSAADKVTGYSDSASFLTLLAPSTSCYTLQCSAKGSTFDTEFGGTSAACPYAAAAAAALQQAAKTVTGKYLTPDEVKTYLTSTGKSITDAKSNIATPRVDLQAAIKALAGNGGIANPAPGNLLLLGE